MSGSRWQTPPCARRSCHRDPIQKQGVVLTTLDKACKTSPSRT